MPATSLEDVARAVCVERGYSFVRKVGAGTFKETFETISAEGVQQALKVFRSGSSILRTKRELQAMLRCDHPNIARLVSVSTFPWQEEEYLFVIEEFVSGGTLTARLATHGRLTLTEVQSLGVSLIDAVAHIASRGLVHRDLKPDNIVLRANGITPVILDFGIVRDLAEVSLTPTWSMRGPGTPLFSAPEQLNNEKAYIDWRADQFSLGVVLSISALGVHPFEEPGCTPTQVVERVAERKPRSSCFLSAATETGLTTLIRMTAPWPAQRARKPRFLAELWTAQLRDEARE